MASRCTAEMPLRLLRMEPESLPFSVPRNRGGGAKSRPVKVPDLRRANLGGMLVRLLCCNVGFEETHGLGMAARSSKLCARGTCALKAGLYGRAVPVGLSGPRPSCRSRKLVGGAKSIGECMEVSSLSMCGVGKD